VYYGTPEAGRDPVWQYLGFVSNEKPSAVFKVVQAKSGQLVIQSTVDQLSNDVVISLQISRSP